MLEIDEKFDVNCGSTLVANDMYDDYSSASSTCSEDEVYDQNLLELNVDVWGLHIINENDANNVEKNEDEAHDEPNVCKEELMSMLASLIWLVKREMLTLYYLNNSQSYL